MGIEHLPLLILLPALLVASGVFSGSETALFRLGRRDLEAIGAASPRAERRLRSLLADPGALLVTVLLLNMTVNVVYFVIVSVLSITSDSTLLQVGISVGSLLALILLGEVLAKLLAGAQRVRFATIISGPLLVAHRTLTPIRIVVKGLVVTPLARLIRPADPSETSAATLEELTALIGLGARSGALSEQERLLLQDVVELGSRRIREVMIPRVDMHWIERSATHDELVDLVRRTRATRFPLCEGSLDGRVLGLADLKPYFAQHERAARAGRRPPPLERFVAPVLFLPENARLDRALATLRERAANTALCVDEHGAITGRLEIERLVETLSLPWSLAERPLVERIRLIALGRWLVPAGVSVRDFQSLFASGASADDAPVGSDTLGGVVGERLGRLPRVGDEVAFRGHRLRVEAMAGRRVALLVVEQGPEGAS